MQPRQLNQSIEQTRALMKQVKNAQNPEAMLEQVLQNNSNTSSIANMLYNSGGNLERVARSMAQIYSIDIYQLIKNLQEGV